MNDIIHIKRDARASIALQQLESAAVDMSEKLLRHMWLSDRRWVAVPIDHAFGEELYTPSACVRATNAIVASGAQLVYVDNLDWSWDTQPYSSNCDVSIRNAKIIALDLGVDILHTVYGLLGMHETIWTSDSTSFVLLHTREEHYVVAGTPEFVEYFIGQSIASALQAWESFANRWPIEDGSPREYYLRVLNHYRQCSSL